MCPAIFALGTGSPNVYKPEADMVKAAYVERKARELSKKIAKNSGVTLEVAHATATEQVTKALSETGAELFADWPLWVKSPTDSEVVEISVAEALDNPYKWNGCELRDPVEPDYNGGHLVAKLYLLQATPVVTSFAHGRRTFRLHRQSQRIELVHGCQHQAVNAVIDVLRVDPSTFDYAGHLVVATGGGEVMRVTRDTARYHLAGVARFYKRTPRNGAFVDVLEDPPQDLAATVLGLGVNRNLKKLDAVITAPIMRVDGSMLDQPGYDVRTRLLLDPPARTKPIPVNPTQAQLKEAFECLWHPFSLFPFAGPVDRAVMLAAVLTAVQRPVLEKAPAFVFDATQHGSGKSMLAECVSIIATGEPPTVMGHVGDEMEIRKRLMMGLLAGLRVMNWDNVMGTFNSAALAAFMTAPSYMDRILGGMGNGDFPNRILMLFTGNNFTPAGELPRRMLVARLEPQTENPFGQTFPFSPAAVVTARRLAIVRAALTLLAGFKAAKPKATRGPLGSFEGWDAMVSQCCLWVAENVDTGGITLGDPNACVEAHVKSDPVKEARFDFLESWSTVFGDRWVTISDVYDTYLIGAKYDVSTQSKAFKFAESLKDVMVVVRDVSAKKIGQALGYLKGHPTNGWQLERNGGSRAWRVVECPWNE